MKMYIFEPKGTENSFVVCAESEEKAREIITDHVNKNYRNTSERKFDADGWGSDYYAMRVLEIGQVGECRND